MTSESKVEGDQWVQVAPPAPLIRFEDLGGQIQQLLVNLKKHSSNNKVSSEEMSLLSTVTVHEMAVVFEGGTDNPEIVLRWLLLRAKQRQRLQAKKNRVDPSVPATTTGDQKRSEGSGQKEEEDEEDENIIQPVPDYQEFARQVKAAEEEYAEETLEEKQATELFEDPASKIAAEEVQGRIDARLQERRAFGFMIEEFEQQVEEMEMLKAAAAQAAAAAKQQTERSADENYDLCAKETQGRLELKLEERRAFTFMYETFSEYLDQIAETAEEIDRLVHNKEQQDRLNIRLEEKRLRTYWETQSQLSKKDCLVFEAEQGHQRRYDSKHRACRVNYQDGTVEPIIKKGEVEGKEGSSPTQPSSLPPALMYLISHHSEKWALHYDQTKRCVVYLHRPSGMKYDDPLEVLGIPEELTFSPCVSEEGGKEVEHPADYLLEHKVWMQIPEDEEGHSVVYWNEVSNDSTYYLKEEWARPTTAKPAMKALALERIAAERKRKAESGADVGSPLKKAPPAGPKKIFLKIWQESWNCYYYQNLRTNKTTWDHPGKDCNIYAAVESKDGELFYQNERTESTRWDLPTASAGATLQTSSSTGCPDQEMTAGTTSSNEGKKQKFIHSEARQSSIPEVRSPKVTEAPDVFIELKSEGGDPYYMNFKTGETMWERPKVWSHSDTTAPSSPGSDWLAQRQHSVRLFKQVEDEGTGAKYYWNETSGSTTDVLRTYSELNDEFGKKTE